MGRWAILAFFALAGTAQSEDENIHSREMLEKAMNKRSTSVAYWRNHGATEQTRWMPVSKLSLVDMKSVVSSGNTVTAWVRTDVLAGSMPGISEDSSLIQRTIFYCDSRRTSVQAAVLRDAAGNPLSTDDAPKPTTDVAPGSNAEWLLEWACK